MLLAGLKAGGEMLQETRYSKQPWWCWFPLWPLEPFLNPADIWLPGVIITLLVRTAAPKLALLLGIVSHSFSFFLRWKWVPDGEKEPPVRWTLLCHHHRLPENPCRGSEKSTCQTPGNHYLMWPEQVSKALGASAFTAKGRSQSRGSSKMYMPNVWAALCSGRLENAMNPPPHSLMS